MNGVASKARELLLHAEKQRDVCALTQLFDCLCALLAETHRSVQDVRYEVHALASCNITHCRILNLTV